MKKTLITAVAVAALSAPAFAGGLDPVVQGEDIMEPAPVVAGSLGSAGGALPALLVLGLLAAAASGSN